MHVNFYSSKIEIVLNEKITLGVNLPSAILELAYSMKAGNASGRKNRVLSEMNNNSERFL